MAADVEAPATLLSVPGISLSACSAGLYNKDRLDLALIAIEAGSSCAAVFTKNSFSAAPVQIARKHLQETMPKYCLINAGNANAGTGSQGIKDAIDICDGLAKIVASSAQEILPFSTGVIGEFLPVDPICDKLPELCSNLGADNWLQCVKAIMTTDTVEKGVSKQLVVDDKNITITGIAKGSGMIRPDMATMLAFIATDASTMPDVCRHILREAMECSFNRICIDGDTSTNDACLLIATGKNGSKPLDNVNCEAALQLKNAVTEVCVELAKLIIRDGEGATKFITIEVQGGQSSDECLRVAYNIASSPLVKTAFYASDPNWGRILAAVGRSSISNLSISDVSIFLDDICIVSNGGRAATYTEELGKKVMLKSDIVLKVNLGRGVANETVWTCDLTHNYIKINAEYRT